MIDASRDAAIGRDRERALPDPPRRADAVRGPGQCLELRRQDAGLHRPLVVGRVHQHGRRVRSQRTREALSRPFCSDRWNKIKNTSSPIATISSPNRTLARRILRGQQHLAHRTVRAMSTDGGRDDGACRHEIGLGAVIWVRSAVNRPQPSAAPDSTGTSPPLDGDAQVDSY
jgi:hypothetical protein